MDSFQVFKVYPSIPESLHFLDYLSKNLWWCWNYEAVELFRRINPEQWAMVGQNPVAFLASISQRRFEELSQNDSFIGHMERVKARFEGMFAFSAGEGKLEIQPRETIAYLSMEFGLHESLPFFAGGLGVLAGDHLKASSSIGIPVTGVGLLFRGGYFHQFLDHEGWQQETYPEIDLFDLPVQRAVDKGGNEVRIKVAGPLGTILAQVWQLKVGRVRLLLLDTNILENPPKIRDVTARLYASDPETRIAQEALLGIGGMRALAALDLFPSVCHLNEGHCSFAGLERLHQIMVRHGVDMETALVIQKRTCVFTTHTPVAAGHDKFPQELVIPYLENFIPRLGTTMETMLGWGQVQGKEEDELFGMSVLAIRLAGHINGVSMLHGKVARAMWRGIWPGLPEDEVPISHVTNGVHILSYISQQKSALFERYLAADWGSRPCNRDLISRIDNIADEDLWHTHGIDRSRLIRHCRKMLLKQYGLRNAPRDVIEDLGSALDYNILTICFARRFATYKRADLILKDPERLEKIINSKTMPVQFVMAGKAHPSDDEGKRIIQRMVDFARKSNLRHRFVFLEDYDINVARYMVQGADVWLNTPRRPFEACGTSGMKAAVNGGLNMSIMDGWWCEGYREDRGWSIGTGGEYEEDTYQDAMDSQALYNILENDVIPCFYERKMSNPPTRWIAMMKESMKMGVLHFSSYRMVKEYSNRFYRPAAIHMGKLTAHGAKMAMELAVQEKRIQELWGEIRVGRPSMESGSDFKVGDRFKVTVAVELGELSPEDVEVQVYFGKLRSLDHLKGGRTVAMELTREKPHGACIYSAFIPCSDSGRFGYTARVIPAGDKVLTSAPGLITWAE